MNQPSKHRAVVPGKAILGEQASAVAQAAALGGSVVPGKKVLGESGAVAEAARLQAAREAARLKSDPNEQTGKVKPPVQKPALPSVKGRVPVKKGPDIQPGATEAEAIQLLESDPNNWDRVLDLEVKRSEGVRLAVARALLEHGPKAKKPKMPPAIQKRLQKAIDTMPKAEGDGAPPADAPVPPVPSVPVPVALVEGTEGDEGADEGTDEGTDPEEG